MKTNPYMNAKGHAMVASVLGFRRVIHNRFIELNWWNSSHPTSMGGRRIPGDVCYAFLMAGRLELYVGRL